MDVKCLTPSSKYQGAQLHNLLFISIWYSIVWIHHNSVILSLVAGYLGCFQFLKIMHIATINILILSAGPEFVYFFANDDVLCTRWWNTGPNLWISGVGKCSMWGYMYIFITNKEEIPMTITVLISVSDRVDAAGVYSCFSCTTHSVFTWLSASIS